MRPHSLPYMAAMLALSGPMMARATDDDMNRNVTNIDPDEQPERPVSRQVRRQMERLARKGVQL